MIIEPKSFPRESRRAYASQWILSYVSELLCISMATGVTYSCEREGYRLANWPHTVFESMQWITDILCSSVQSASTKCLVILYIPDGKVHFCLFCDHGKHSRITESVDYRKFCSVAFGEQDLTVVLYSETLRNRNLDLW